MHLRVTLAVVCMLTLVTLCRCCSDGCDDFSHSQDKEGDCGFSGSCDCDDDGDDDDDGNNNNDDNNDDDDDDNGSSSNNDDDDDNNDDDDDNNDDDDDDDDNGSSSNNDDDNNDGATTTTTTTATTTTATTTTATTTMGGNNRRNDGGSSSNDDENDDDDNNNRKRKKRRSTTKVCSTTHFYCHDDQTCRPRYLRCSEEPSICVVDSICFAKAANNCDYHPPSNSFKVYKGSSVTFRIGIRGWFEFMHLYHNQIMFRGLTYEYGKYGLLVHDQNDPNYKYGNTKRVQWEYIGLSNCTYDEVMQFANAWVNESDYSAVMHNCQHFAAVLSNFILDNCTNKAVQSDALV